MHAYVRVNGAYRHCAAIACPLDVRLAERDRHRTAHGDTRAGHACEYGRVVARRRAHGCGCRIGYPPSVTAVHLLINCTKKSRLTLPAIFSAMHEYWTLVPSRTWSTVACCIRSVYSMPKEFAAVKGSPLRSQRSYTCMSASPAPLHPAHLWLRMSGHVTRQCE